MMLGRRLPPAFLHRTALCPYARCFEFLVPNLPPTQLLFFAIPHLDARKSVAAAFVFLVTHQFFFVVLLTLPHCLTFLLYFDVFFCARIIICVLS